MGALDWLAGHLGYVRPRRASNGFAAADMGRLTSSLAAETRFINDQLRYDLRRLRARSRQAAKNNPFARRFVKMYVANVGGPEPFRLQAKTRYSDGRFDEAANKKIESVWRAWSTKGECEITGCWSWNTLQRQILQVFATDGEVLLRKYKGGEYGKHGIQLQLIDTDRLDESKNQVLQNGSAIYMGVEVDAQQRRVAYHLMKRKPSQWQNGGYAREYERVPADEIIHLYLPEYAEQVRGIPPMYAAMLQLVHLGAFEEAAVIAARLGAAQAGVIQSPDGGRTLAEQQGGTATAEPTLDLSQPGVFPTLPPGYTLQGWNPKYPDAAVEPFIKACLRGVASGLDCAYHNLSGDMEGVNYSSARIAELDERDGWLGLQVFVADHLHQPFYCHDWLPMQAMMRTLPYPLDRLDKYRDVKWQGRRWQWVDPLKEVKAAIEANNHRLKSRTQIVAENGDDIEDVFADIQSEEQLAKDKGIKLDMAPKPAVGSGAGGDDHGDDHEDDDGDAGKNPKPKIEDDDET
jgi:lambda family phage portal protein